MKLADETRPASGPGPYFPHHLHQAGVQALPPRFALVFCRFVPFWRGTWRRIGAGAGRDRHRPAAPKPDLTLLDGEPAEAVAAARAAVDAPDGLGTIACYATEVALPATGTWNAPGKGGAQPDIVRGREGGGAMSPEPDRPAREIAAHISSGN